MLWIIIGFIVLFWIGVKLNRWVNSSSKIAKNQEKILEELRKPNKRITNFRLTLDCKRF